MARDNSTISVHILEEASLWFIDFNEGEVDAAGKLEFNAWLRRSPEHVEAYLQVSAFWECAGSLGNQPDADIDALLARTSLEQNVFRLETVGGLAKKQSVDGSRKRMSLIAVTATFALAVSAGLFFWYSDHGAPIYAAKIGEQRYFALEDGSAVELNSRSRIKVSFTDDERAIQLLEGQALFRVSKDPDRPFIVHSGDATVRAVGTEFDVYKKQGGVVVTVVEGRVAVVKGQRLRQRPLAADVVQGGEARQSGAASDEVLVAAGQQLTVMPATAVDVPIAVDVEVATAWTERKLIFVSTPLREVVQEFNRYNLQQLVIRDADINDVELSGTFHSTDSRRIVEFLRQRFDITISRSGDEIHIWRRDAAT